MTIIVNRGANGYMASLEGQSYINGIGRTEAEAIGDMIRNHPDTFDLEFKGGSGSDE